MRESIVVMLMCVGLWGCSVADDRTYFLQRTCPFLEGSPINHDLYAELDGHRIYTCCEDCLEKVHADPQLAMANLRARGERTLTIKEAATWDAKGRLPSWTNENGSDLWRER